MLSTLLVRMPWLAFAVVILALLLAPLVGAWLATKPRLTRALLAVVAITASAAIETEQALLLVIGRACDMSDLVTNAIGAILGGLCAWGALLVRRTREGRAGGPTAVP